MKAKHLLPLLLALLLLPAAKADVVVNFDGTTNTLVTASVNWGTVSSTTLIQSAGNPDIVRSMLPYGTTFATNGVGTYTGPTLKGVAYENSLYEEGTATLPSPSVYWGQIINNGGTPAQDYIQIRRNNSAGTTGTINASSTTRAVFTFDTGGSYSFEGTSVLSLTGGLGSATSDIGRWVVVSGGTTYISESTFDPHNSNNTTVYNYDNPDATNWAAWTPNSDLSNVPDFTTTVAGSTLTAITEVGFFFDKTGTTQQNPTFRVFTADLSTGSAPAVAPAGVAVAIVGADIELTFDSVANQSYQLLLSTDDMATFAPVSGASGTGDGTPLTLTHTGGAPASGTRVFYQIEAN